MSAVEPHALLADEFESHVQAFEEAWQLDPCPDWSHFVSERPRGPSQLNPQLLRELVAIDIERRWGRGLGRPIEEYLDKEPILNEPSLLLELIAEEYRARCRLCPPSHDEFRKRFPAIGDLVRQRLAEVDRDRHDEIVPPADSFARLITNVEPVRILPDPQARLQYDDYLLERFIGSGGSGKVYRAHERSQDRRVAIKFLKKSFQNRPEIVERFLVEARIVSRLRHEGIVNTHGMGQTPRGGYFLAMDWLPAGDLNRQMQDGMVMVNDAAHWVRDTALAIQYAHEQDVVHCDLKPANVLLDSSRRAVITDFGLARSATVLADEKCWFEGTASFMALEQAIPGFGEIGPWTDIYGLGAILYALLTGHAPYSGRRPSDVLSQLIANRPIPTPSSQRSEIPPSLERICLQCLDRDPAQRPESGREVAQRLQAIINDLKLT